jgi:hypothetical protein
MSQHQLLLGNFLFYQYYHPLPFFTLSLIFSFILYFFRIFIYPSYMSIIYHVPSFNFVLRKLYETAQRGAL